MNRPRLTALRRLEILCCSIACLGTVGSGCSGGPGYSHATVAGTVTVDGDPVPKGHITFSPAGGSQGPVTGAPIENGKYRCEAVPVGSHVVTFIAQAAEPVKIMDHATGTEQLVPQNILPQAYQQGVPVEVEEGEIVRDFEMTTGGNEA
jgi:hypothetical protein